MVQLGLGVLWHMPLPAKAAYGICINKGKLRQSRDNLAVLAWGTKLGAKPGSDLFQFFRIMRRKMPVLRGFGLISEFLTV